MFIVPPPAFLCADFPFRFVGNSNGAPKIKIFRRQKIPLAHSRVDAVIFDVRRLSPRQTAKALTKEVTAIATEGSMLESWMSGLYNKIDGQKITTKTSTQALHIIVLFIDRAIYPESRFFRF